MTRLRRERFVMLDPCDPVNPTAEELTWRVSGVTQPGREVVFDDAPLPGLMDALLRDGGSVAEIARRCQLPVPTVEAVLRTAGSLLSRNGTETPTAG